MKGGSVEENRPRGPSLQTSWPLLQSQILAGKVDTQLQPHGQLTCLGRLCIEYDGFLEGEEQDVPYKTAVRRLVSLPYLLSSIAREAQNASHYFVREIVALEEDVTTDKDLTPF